MQIIKNLITLRMLLIFSLTAITFLYTNDSFSKPQKLPYNMRKSIKDINRTYQKFERAKEKGKHSDLESYYRYAERYWKNIEKNLKKNPGTYKEVEKAREQMASMKSYVQASSKGMADAAKKSKAEKEQSANAVKEWGKKFEKYYYGSNKLDIYNGTYSMKEFNRQQKLYNTISALFLKYENAGSPGKTKLMESNNFRSLEKALVGYLKYKKESEKRILEKLTNLFKKFKASMEKGNPIQRRDVVYANRELKRIKSENGKYGVFTSAKLSEVEGELNSLINRSDKKRNEKAKSTYMEPDKYRGSDSKKLKAKAESILRKAISNAKPLHTVIIRGEWEVLSEWKWADSSRSARYYHTYRQLKTQIAAKVKNEVRLYFVYLFQDKKSGRWGIIYGHSLDYYHLISEKNVDVKR